MQTPALGFIGAGAIAEALTQGVLTAGLWQPQRIFVCNRQNRARLQELAKRWQITPLDGLDDVVQQSDIVVLAVKPKDVAGAMTVVGPSLRPGQTLISIAAGVPLASLRSHVPAGVGLIRAMPNTSCQVGAAATAIAAAADTDTAAVAVAETIFGAVGTVVHVPEHLLDAVTGLSGSGPAYVYLLIEALIGAGTDVGLSPDVARELALQTVLGAAKMVLDTGEQPEVLRQRVCSPGGTTLAALEVLTARGFVPAVQAAVQRATARSREMGEEVAALVDAHAAASAAQ